GRLQHRALVRRKGLKLAHDRCGDRRGNILLGNGRLIRPRREVSAAAGSGTELLQIERVTAALEIESLTQWRLEPLAEKLLRLLGSQRSQLNSLAETMPL